MADAKRLALSGARVLLYLSAIVGMIVGGCFLDSALTGILAWSDGRAALGHMLWTIGAALGAGGLALRALGGRGGELAAAWVAAELCLAAAVASELSWSHSSYWEWWTGLSIPLALWLAGVGTGSVLARFKSQ